MIIKNISIELQRKNKQSIIVSLHPGTVDSNLSKPFQNNTNMKNILSPTESVKNLTDVLQKLEPINTGKLFSWKGEEIEP